MSLIHNALKRARQAQANQPPGGAPASRPAQPARPSKTPMPFVTGAVLATLLLAALFVWVLGQHRSAGAPPARSPQPAIATPLPSRAPGRAAVETKPAPSTKTAAGVPKRATTPAPPRPPAAAGAPGAPTNAIIDVPPPDIPASSLKLQAIFYNPNRPSAIITGRTVSIGDVIGGLRVAKITPDRVTLVQGAHTNVLLLSQ